MRDARKYVSTWKTGGRKYGAGSQKYEVGGRKSEMRKQLNAIIVSGFSYQPLQTSDFRLQTSALRMRTLHTLLYIRDITFAGNNGSNQVIVRSSGTRIC